MLMKRMMVIIKKAFTLYLQMSAGTALRLEWDEIVTETCFTTTENFCHLFSFDEGGEDESFSSFDSC